MIDTQIFLRAAIKPESLPGHLMFELSDFYQLLVSPPLRAEVFDVLHRPELRARFPHLTDELAGRVMARFATAEWVEPEETRSVSRDPGDDMLLDCARSGGADYIVSEDKDLLILNPHEGIPIIKALDFVAILRALRSG